MTEEQKKSLRANFQEDQNLGVVPTATYTAPNSIYNVPKTLTSDLLAPSSNMNLNVPAQTSVAPAMQGTLEAQAEATKVANEEKQRLAQQSNDVVAKEEVKNKSLREYVAGLFGSSGETAIRDQEYTNNKVDVAKNELNEINNELLTEQNALRRRIEETEKTFGGTTSGLQTEINRLKNESLSKQADLSIIQMAKQNNFSAVKEIADRAVALKLEQQKQTNEILKFVYEENKDLFTKAEQRQFEEAQKERDREYEEKLSKEKGLSEIKQSLLKSASSQNAPASVLRAIQGSGTSEEAIVAAGQYAGDILDRTKKQAELVKLNAEIAKIKSETGEATKPKLTAVQSSALGYANRVNQANQVIDDLGSKFTSLGSYFGGINVFGIKIPNILKSSERQQYEQAQRNFVNAVLRRESGAAISKSEFENAELQYFPQLGDSEAVVKQKKENRDLTFENLMREGGQKVDTTPPNRATQVEIDYIKSLNL